MSCWIRIATFRKCFDRPTGGLLVRRVANRRWGSKQALLAELQRLVDGRPARRRPSKRKINPDLEHIEARIRDRLQMRTQLTGDGQSGELRVTLSTVADFERLMEILGA